MDLCAQIYGGAGNWDHLDEGQNDGGYWALKRLDGFEVVVFRGSITRHDRVNHEIDLSRSEVCTEQAPMKYRCHYDAPSGWTAGERLAEKRSLWDPSEIKNEEVHYAVV